MPYHTEAKLFSVGDFISHAGLPLKWKIECDAISPDQWSALAEMIMDYQTEPFSRVVGIPRGGLPLEWAMQKHVQLLFRNDNVPDLHTPSISRTLEVWKSHFGHV